MAFVDLSHTVRSGMAQVPTLPRVEVERILSIAAGGRLNVQQVRLATHAGTHVDAPLHVFADGEPIDRIPLDRFHGPGVAIPVDRGGDEAIGVRDLEPYAALVRPGDIVLLATGWDRHFGQESYYLHPHLDVEAARWLVERRVKLVGVDWINPDAPFHLRGPSFDYPVHRTLLGNGVLIAENLTGVRALAGRRLTVFALPWKVDAGDAGQARIVAQVEEGPA